MANDLMKKCCRTAFGLALFSAFLISCHDPAPDHPVSSPLAAKSTASGTGFIKRLEGTVGGKAVTLLLTATRGRYQGIFYYGDGLPVELSSYSDTSDGGEIRLDEFHLTAAAETAEQPYWQVRLDGDSVRGTRTGNHGESGEIRLKEQYPAGSYPLELVYRSTRASYHESSDTPFAVSTYRLFWPVNIPAASSPFISRVFMQLAGCREERGTTSARLLQCMEEKDVEYFREYRKIINDAHMQPEDWPQAFNNYSKDLYWDIMQNGNGWLVLKATSAEYTGGAHGNYSCRYYCVDVAEERVWTPEDILKADSSRLKVLLDMAARKHFRISQGSSLQERLLVDEIPVTDNICITPAGLLFCYQPYEIASYADGAVSLFIHYRELKSMLTEPFKARMQLYRQYKKHLI